ncbi:hypothetical protein [Bdellovibrio sp. NC01]|uniref:hypothetical protein n=1 Tax=Bdellovibrio sp. NC01 TaxID=2220073 RepID=UPI001157FB11|nr:hypothetical protein [Bdellovibrio sp. NC01]QDK37227.1 hypothetical protein DOE51_06295 [Bdellovibrio sp. NC01]
MKFVFKNSLLKAMILSLVGSSFLGPAVYATQRSKVRQESRDTRQTGRDDARTAKQECRSADDKSNAACRRDKRQSKGENREEARDIKY